MHVWMRVLRNRTVSSTPRWEKVLYKKQPFSDNYTDERCFLDQLRTNVGLLRYSKRDAIRAGVIVMSQVDLVVLFLCCFESVQTNVLDELNLFRLVMCTSGVLVCCSLYIQHSLDGEIILVDWKSPSSWWEKIQTLLTILGFGYAFTPVIRTLTTSISTDTIYTSAILLFLASLFVHNYGMDAPIVSTAFSVNLCLTASVFLISRLQSDFQAFMLLGLSLCLFCFWPRIRCAILHHSPPFSLLLLFPLGIGSIACLNVLFDPMLAFAHFVLHFFIVILFPMLFVRMQKLKSTIHGPWDEATLRASIN